MTEPATTSSDVEEESAPELPDVVRAWAEETATEREKLRKVAYRESTLTEDHLDVVLVVEDSEISLAERGAHWDFSQIAAAAPTQILVYTADEWEGLSEAKGPDFTDDMVWVYER